MSLKRVATALSFATMVFVCALADAQVAPSATDGGLRLKVGAGFSDYQGDLRNGRLQGGALWLDFVPPRLPSVLRGLGVEIEARGVTASNTPPTTFLSALRQSTVGGGPTYTYLRFPRFHPYAKFLMDYAGQSFNVGARGYHFETQTAYAPGGGVDYRAYSSLWVRADYEYQIWPDPFNNHNWYLDPRGVTVGLAWEFGARHRY
jgi:opacity protein-like surface antigen